MTRSQLLLVVATIGCLVMGRTTVETDQANIQSAKPGEWAEYSGGTNGWKYSPLDQINKENVKALRVAWRWATADRALDLRMRCFEARDMKMKALRS